MNKGIMVIGMLLCALLLFGCTQSSNGNQVANTQPTSVNNNNNNSQSANWSNPPVAQVDWKAELKSQIDAIGGVGMPNVTMLNQANGELDLEYSSWEVPGGEASVFEEQQKVAPILVSYFAGQTPPQTVKIRVVSSAPHNKNTYLTTLTWIEIQQLADLGLSQSTWEGKTSASESQ